MVPYDWTARTNGFMLGGDRGNMGGFSGQSLGLGMSGANGLDFSGMGNLNPNSLTQTLPDFGKGLDVNGYGNGYGLGWNVPTAGLALGGLQAIGSLWNAWEANKLAKKQFNFTKDVTNTNLGNSIRAYNTTLEDRARSRAVVEGQTPAQAQAYVDKNKATRSGMGG